jgi:DNA phosphorothioation-dependent restriction protein DptG
MSKLLCNAIELLSPNSCLSGGLTYESVVWKENATNIPTKEQVESKIEELRLLIPMKKLRHERNIKLLETDKYSINDWPHASEEVKQAWVTYRQALRDLPSISTPQLDENGNLTNVTWPTPPS